MSLLGNGIEFLEIDDYNDSEGGGVDHRISRLGGDEVSGNTMEAEKRIRREIANSNERRRMQSINAGFQSLRTLLPRHEGEKLSKAAILQQTAEYIYALEQEKTRLLSQNCQLKRLLNQHEGGDIPIKKRKAEVIISDPETSPAEVPGHTPSPAGESPSPPELEDLRVQLEQERRVRLLLQEQLRALEAGAYPEQITLQYESAELDPAEMHEMHDVHDVHNVHDVHEVHDMVTVAMMPAREASDERLDMRLLAEEVEEKVVVKERPPSPEILPERSPSPPDPLLEAAINAKPKVEVEVLPVAPASPGESSRLYLASTSRQNLETIVEAIRHLEGDHLFAEEQQQELPLALTTKPVPRLLRMEMNDLLQFRPQSRPGVIVVKHS